MIRYPYHDRHMKYNNKRWKLSIQYLFMRIQYLTFVTVWQLSGWWRLRFLWRWWQIYAWLVVMATHYSSHWWQARPRESPKTFLCVHCGRPKGGCWGGRNEITVDGCQVSVGNENTSLHYLQGLLMNTLHCEVLAHLRCVAGENRYSLNSQFCIYIFLWQSAFLEL